MLGISSFLIHIGAMHTPDGDACLMMTETSACIAAHAARPELAVVRATLPLHRPTIIGRPEFFVRYGEKEKEAVASFDFLDELSTTSSSLSCSLDEAIAEEEEEEEDLSKEVDQTREDVLRQDLEENMKRVQPLREEVYSRFMRFKVSQV